QHVILLLLMLVAAGCSGDAAAHTVRTAAPPTLAAQPATSGQAPAAPSAATVVSPSPTPAPTSSPVPAPPSPAPTRAPDDLLRFISKTSEPLPASYVPPDLVPLSAAL